MWYYGLYVLGVAVILATEFVAIVGPTPWSTASEAFRLWRRRTLVPVYAIGLLVGHVTFGTHVQHVPTAWGVIGMVVFGVAAAVVDTRTADGTERPWVLRAIVLAVGVVAGALFWPIP